MAAIIFLLCSLQFLSAASQKDGFVVITDYDDTIIAAGYDLPFSMLSGGDTTKHHVMYPGYASFVYFLILGENTKTTRLWRTAELIICTARPKLYNNLIDKKKKSEKLFRHNADGSKRERFVEITKVMYGNIFSNFYTANLGKRKYAQIKRLVADGKGAGKSKRYIFLGDNGQADVFAMRKLLDEGIIDFGLVHTTVANERFDSGYNPSKMIRFRNYLDAAKKMHKLGHISKEGMDIIQEEYVNEYKKLGELDQFIDSDSDFDDTIVAAGYNYPKSAIAGADTSKTHRVYPGFPTFAYYLNLGDFKTPEKSTTAEIILCTARPKIAIFRINKERKSKEIFGTGANNAKRERELVISEILYGSIFSNLDFYRYANRKFIKIKEHVKASKIDGGKGHIFIGDNGQGDVLAGKMLLKENVVDFVFIHAVVGEEPFATNEVDERMVLFKDYLQLSQILNGKGILSASQLKTIKKDYEEEARKMNHAERLIDSIPEGV